MQPIATYSSYAEANERQLDLLAANIEAKVEYLPTGFEQVYFGTNPIYALVVDEDHVADAREIIRLIPDESHRSILRCPSCNSENVRERRLDEGFGSEPIPFPLTLGLVVLYRTIRAKWSGTNYECGDCGARYRKKP